MADEADSADGAARWTRWRDGRGYGFPAAAPPALPRGRPDRLHPTAAGSQGGRAGVRGGCRSPDTWRRSRWCPARAPRSTPPPPACSPTSRPTSEVRTSAVARVLSPSLFASASESDELRVGDRLWLGAQMPTDSAGVAGRRRRGRPWIGRPK